MHAVAPRAHVNIFMLPALYHRTVGFTVYMPPPARPRARARARTHARTHTHTHTHTLRVFSARRGCLSRPYGDARQRALRHWGNHKVSHYTPPAINHETVSHGVRRTATLSRLVVVWGRVCTDRPLRWRRASRVGRPAVRARCWLGEVAFPFSRDFGVGVSQSGTYYRMDHFQF